MDLAVRSSPSIKFNFVCMCSLLGRKTNRTKDVGIMRKTHVEKSEMSSVEFCQSALRERIAPPSLGSVKARIQHATRKTGWTYSRVKDVWYADPRISINAEQLIQIEALSGLEYARREVRTNDELIARAEALLHGQDPDFDSAFVTALRAFAGIFYRSGATGE